MQKHFILVFLLLVFTTEKIVSSVPNNAGKTLSQESESNVEAEIKHLTDSLCKHIKDKQEQVKAIYKWIAQNISYDVTCVNTPNTNSLGVRLRHVMEKRYGICQHYSDLFVSMCGFIEVESWVVNGFTKQNNELSQLGHAWNVAKIYDDYFLFDVTWGAGYIKNGTFVKKYNPKFCMTSPAAFAKSHIPYETYWQLQNYPISFSEFIQGIANTASVKTFYNYADSIKTILQLEPYKLIIHKREQLKSSIALSSLIRNEVDRLDIELANYYLNMSINAYNIYVLAKNEQFKNPKISDETVEKMIQMASLNLNLAERNLDGITTQDKVLFKSLLAQKKYIKDYKPKVQNEMLFVEEYVQTSRLFRILLFYEF